MAYVYNVEPNTNGKVVLHTTAGDVDIELWSEQAPLACRNFIQLCLEHYYDNTIFHRVLKKLLIQGGDPTGTGRGGESIWDKAFKDELSPRLRFSHRGIVAMANENKPDTNHSQFFITLDAADWLTGKHTIFGKVVGNTLFNVLKMGELETDKEDHPLYPPVIKSISVIVNPFDDIIPREFKHEEKAEKKEDNRRQVKQVKNSKLLSFGDEEDEEEGLSSRIVSFQESQGVAKKEDLKPVVVDEKEKMRKEKESAWVKKMKEKIMAKMENADMPVDNPVKEEEEENVDDSMKEKVKEKIREMKKKSKELEKELKTPAIPIEKPEETVLSASEYKRQRKRRRNEVAAERTQDTLAALAAFKSKLKCAWKEKESKEEKENQDEEKKVITQNDLLATTRTDLVDDDDDENAENESTEWMTNQLKFVKHFEDSLRDGSFEPSVDLYVTEDPLQSNPVDLDNIVDE
ncbi:peptidyl-prolyl cis-trans isomerase [Blastocystis sp. subtype 4]|uniref:peptidyl-prolyl cis-trans isomerase n=1 Tax=Blastocystis sp. subtype 4 TaxID=944170 RepID=UPI0007112EAC|nr:peptidyl-prolyl cis-trans isomerase [Blastocystis sp. subtype 4]KNB44041.1 peptidyl-prolyl cis-trans isomerase [Blastocystis sp. subtype 4]|eukprot:XP_014527478.1 peptidyl-prolyl cis-trans isomerase [Blastocystis sp. subtype 4]